MNIIVILIIQYCYLYILQFLFYSLPMEEQMVSNMEMLFIEE